MSITSLQFLTLFAVSLALYYLIPKKLQWYALVVYSVCFFVLSSAVFTGIYLLVNIAVTYLCVRLMKRTEEDGVRKWSKSALLIGIIVNVGILAVLKYSNFFIGIVNSVICRFGTDFRLPETEYISPIGISFYTVISVGYLLDCYWMQAADTRTGFLKTALFISYFPQMTSGPITKYQQMEGQLYAPHSFDYTGVAFGLQRILWGLFKKLVISTRVAGIVNSIYGNMENFAGLYIWTASFLFMLQLYTDFSGCMDIIMGVSECYGIKLPENFRTPFFARSVQEYWQRWHITLGVWLRDYILYPILRTETWRKMSKWIKAHWGKKLSKQIPSYLGMLCVWLLIGLWHGGGWKYILGMGLWFWGCIVLSDVFQPVFKKMTVFMKIDTESFSWHLFQSLRVFVLVSVGNMFFRLNSLSETIRAIKIGFAVWNPWIFFDGSMVKVDVTHADLNIIIFGVFLLFVVWILQEKYTYARVWIQRQILPFRWIVWLGLAVLILVYGNYGPGYDAADFIYRGF